MSSWHLPATTALTLWLIAASAIAQVRVESVEKGQAGDAAGVQAGDIVTGWSTTNDGNVQEIAWPFDLLLAEETGARREAANLHVRRNGRDLILSIPAGRWGIRSSPPPGGEPDRSDALSALESARQNADADLLPKLQDLDGSAEWHAAIAWQIGDLLADQQLWDRAQTYWQHSQTLITDADQRALQTARLARAAFCTREIDRAGELATESLEYWTTQNADMHVLQLQTLLGFIAFEHRDLGTAETQFTRAVEQARDMQPLDPTAVSALRGLGQVRAVQGRFDEAVKLGRKIVAMAAAIAPDSRAQAKALSFLGVVLVQRQDLSEAEPVLLQALEIVDRISPQSPDAAGIRNNLAMLHYYRRDFARARRYYEQALAAAEKINPVSATVARTRYNIALTYANEGLHAQAAQQLEQVLALQQELTPDSEDVARTLHSLAMRFDAAGDLQRAREFETRALALYRRILPDSYSMATSAHKLGQIELRDNAPDKAQPFLAEALHIARRDAFNTTLHAEAVFDLGEVHHLAGDTATALAHFQEAVGAIESLQSRLGGGDEALSAFRDYYAHFFDRLVEALLEQDRAADAFEVSERYRAQAFLALLNSRPAALLNQTPEDVAADYLEAQSAFELALGAARENSAANPQELEQVRIAWQEAGDRLRAASAAGQVLVPSFVSAKQASAHLPNDIVVLSFVAGDDAVNIFALSHGQPLQHFRADIAHDELTDLVARVRVLVAAPDAGEVSRAALDKLLSRLGEALLGPALADIKPGTQLLVLPDRELWMLPFSALRVNDAYVAQQWPLQLSWSTTSYLDANSGTSSAIELVAFADPLSGIEADFPVADRRGEIAQSLPAAIDEVERISAQFNNKQIYSRAAATEAAFREHAGNASVVHVAAHAFTAVTPPLEAYLQLAPDSKHDGRMMVWEVMSSLDLDAELVVLSGCATGLGMEQSGEGLMGLTRAFGIAGARRVLASHWPVMDTATAALMSGFYSVRANDFDDAQALQEVQRQFIDGTAGRENGWSRLIRTLRGQSSPDHSHPFYWAAFSLYGAQP